MPEIATLSKTGEIKIPLRVRTRLGLQPGQKLEVVIEGRNLVLSVLGPNPDLAVREFLQWKEQHPEPDVILLNRPKKESTRRKPAKRSTRAGRVKGSRPKK